VGAPAVTIKFLEGEEEQVADVRSGEHGTVQFPGTVEASLPAGSKFQDVVVNLRGYTGEGWTVEVNPSSVQVDPDGTATFSVQAKGNCIDLKITTGPGIINKTYAYNFECGIGLLLILINGIFAYHKIRKKSSH
jgi:hypothetical protein